MIVALWGVATVNWQKDDNGYRFLMPVSMIVAVILQVSLWQFIWPRLAQLGGHWRSLAELFSRAVRYPIVRSLRQRERL